MSDAPSQILRQRWLDAMLPNIPFDGWTEAAMQAAAEEAGISEDEQAFAAPGGLNDLLKTYFDSAESRARDVIASVDLENLRVRDRVTVGVMAWLEVLTVDKEAVRRAAQRGFLPWGASSAVQRSWSVADMIWDAIGDTSEDYNRYTKRGLLSAALPPIIMGWLDHAEDEQEKTEALVQRQVGRAMKTGQFGARLLKPFLRKP